MSDEPTIEEQKEQLIAAGWSAITPTIWKSPWGAVFLGPHGAWKAMKNLQASSENMPVFSAGALIDAFGDQAYYCGCRMVIAALRAGDRDSSRQLSTATRELMTRGYHKFPEKLDWRDAVIES